MSFGAPDTSFSFEAEPFGPIDSIDRRGLGAPRNAVRLLPVVANASLTCSAVVLEHVVAALVRLGRHPLLVDAAATSPPAPAAAALDLSVCIRPFGPHASYLPAGGLPKRRVDAQGSAAQVLRELQHAAPQVDTLVIHAEAADVARMFKGRQAHPLLLATDDPDSLQQAYAGWKWLKLHGGWTRARLLVADASADRAQQMALSLATCAERHLEAELVDWTVLEPQALDHPGDPDATCLQFMADQLGIPVPGHRWLRPLPIESARSSAAQAGRH
jgi:flagellar biosynthesis protein FlhG